MRMALNSGSLVHICIAEANQLNCQLLASALHPKRYHLEVSATATDSKSTLALLKENKLDVAVISAQLQDGPLAGYTVLQELRSMQSKTRCIMLLDARTRELVVDAFRFGAHGAIFRDEPVETLAKCIHAVNEGQVWANSLHLGFLLEALSQISPVRLQDARGSNLLTKREEDVARLVAEGMSNREISRHLKLSEHTVRNYLFRVFEKLGISSRVELVLYCLQQRQPFPSALPN
jgi:two-component system nitrate/nitrite response regulator NarL